MFRQACNRASIGASAVFVRASNSKIGFEANKVSNNQGQQSFCRTIFTSSACQAKEVIIEEKGKITTITGQPVPSPRSSNLIQFDMLPGNKDSCPLCRLQITRLTYKDVPILSQFVESDGKLMEQEATKLCGRQYRFVRRLVKEAQAVGLMPRPADMRYNGAWEQLTSYYDYPKRHRDQPMRLIQPEYWK